MDGYIIIINERKYEFKNYQGVKQFILQGVADAKKDDLPKWQDVIDGIKAGVHIINADTGEV